MQRLHCVLGLYNGDTATSGSVCWAPSHFARSSMGLGTQGGAAHDCLWIQCAGVKIRNKVQLTKVGALRLLRC